MKTLVLLFSSLAVISAYHIRDEMFFKGQINAAELSRYSENDKVLKDYYSVPLDHFSPTSDSRLRLIYEVNVQFFKQGGPLFFFISEGHMDFHTYGLMYEYAQKVNGALVKADFRYHSNNYFGDMVQKELKYLSVEQILGDIPYLVNEVKERLNTTTSRVITFGNRHGGAIAVLARKRFPHIIDAAWSSSGEFRSVVANTGMYEDIAKQIHKHGGDNCTEMLSKALQELKQLADDKNIERIRELFEISENQVIDFNDPQHVQHFFKVLFEVISLFYKRMDSVGTIQDLCTNTVDGKGGLDSFSQWYRDTFEDYQRPHFSYKEVIEITNQLLRFQAFNYFKCFQIGTDRPVTSPNSFQNVFPNVISEQYYDQMCIDIFGARYNRTQLDLDSQSYNLQHGGGTQYVSNTVFSDGKMNPLRHIGVSTYDPNSSKFITTEYHGLGADFGSIGYNDPNEIKAAKEEIVATLSSYIKPADDAN